MVSTPSVVLAERAQIDGKMYTAADCIPATIHEGTYQATLGSVTSFGEDYTPEHGDLQHTFLGHAYNAIDPFQENSPNYLTVICPVVREHSTSEIHQIIVSILWREPVASDFCTFMTFERDGRLYDSRNTWEKISDDFSEVQTFRLEYNSRPITDDFGPLLLMCHIPTADLLTPSQLDDIREYASFIRSYQVDERY